MIGILRAVVLLTFTFALSIQRVTGASVTFSASHSRKIPFRYQGDTYQTWVSIHGGVGSGSDILSRRPLYVRFLPRVSSGFAETAHRGLENVFVGSWYTVVQGSLTITFSHSKISHQPDQSSSTTKSVPPAPPLSPRNPTRSFPSTSSSPNSTTSSQPSGSPMTMTLSVTPGVESWEPNWQ